MIRPKNYIPIELFSKNKKIPELPVPCPLPPPGLPADPARKQGEGGGDGPSVSWAAPASLRPAPPPPTHGTPAPLFFLLPFSPCWAFRQADLPGAQPSSCHLRPLPPLQEASSFQHPSSLGCPRDPRNASPVCSTIRQPVPVTPSMTS